MTVLALLSRAVVGAALFDAVVLPQSAWRTRAPSMDAHGGCDSGKTFECLAGNTDTDSAGDRRPLVRSIVPMPLAAPIALVAATSRSSTTTRAIVCCSLPR
jgi:hypothetical protein